MFNSDLGMYHWETDTRFNCHTTALNEDLGLLSPGAVDTFEQPQGAVGTFEQPRILDKGHAV